MRRQLRQFVKRFGVITLTLILSSLWFVSPDSTIEPLIVFIPVATNFFIGLRFLIRRRATPNLQNLMYFLWLIAIASLTAYWIFNPDSNIEPMILILTTLNSSGNVLVQYRSEGKIHDTRHDLLTRVKKKWISGAFDQVDFIELNKVYMNELVNPIPRLNPIPENKLQQVTHELLDIFDEAERLLILGEPGGGKTTSLQKLASELLLRAENTDQPDSIPIPIYFELTDWAKEKLPFEDWLIREFHREYNVPDSEGYACLRGDLRSVLLLDGLDEMADFDIKLCVDAINEFLTTDDTSIVRPQVAVCARIVEYNALPIQLRVNRAIELQPLTAEQIKTYINKHLNDVSAQTDETATTPAEKNNQSDHLAVFYRGLPKASAPSTARRARLEPFLDLNETMEEVLNTPLILSSVLQSNITLADLRADGEDPKQIENRILRRYIEYVTQHRLEANLNPTQVDRQLAWLARHMGERTNFYIEDLQPSWLKERLWRFMYTFFSRLTIALVIASALGLVVNSIVGNLIGGVICAVVVTLIDYSRFEVAGTKPLPSKTKKPHIILRFGRGFFYFLLVFIPLTAVLSLYYGLTEHAAEGDIVNLIGIELAINGINQAVFLSLFFGAIFGVKSRKERWSNDIDTVEDLQPTRLDLVLSTFLWAMGVGLIIGGLAFIYYYVGTDITIVRWLRDQAALIQWQQGESLAFFFIGFLVGAIAGAIFGVMFGGAKIVEKKKDSLIDSPNIGIQRSFINAVRSAAIFGFSFAVFLSILMYLLTEDIDSVFKGTLDGIAVGVITLVSYGGADLIKHTVLRTIFYLKGLPFHYLDRLDEIKKSTLVRRVGRGYGFYHREVQSIFQQKPSFVEKLDTRRVMTLTGLFIMVVVLLFALQFGHYLLYRYDVPTGAFTVSGLTQPDIDAVCLEAGESVEIHAKGVLKAGAFSGYVHPEGTEIGFMGLPIYDTYDIVAEFPHSSLMCRLQGDADWQSCIPDPAPITPFAWRVYLFTAERAGCLEFHINDKELDNHEGNFWVEVIPRTN